MTRDQYEKMVRRLEGYAQKNARAYRLRVGLLAALGYGYLLATLGVVLALLGLVAWVVIAQGFRYSALKVGLVLLFLAGVMIRAMWVRLPPPVGIELQRADSPELFRMLDEVQAALEIPRFDHVLLTPEFNAGAAQRPRLGVFGWYRNYLLLGLPLMQALSPEEFRAVVAHELGHLSGNHSRFSGWIYRVEASWEQLLAALKQQETKAVILFEWFFKWYVPFFSAYSFVLRRANEYVADRCAAEVAGRETAGRALGRVKLAGRLLEEKYWPSLYEGVADNPHPPATAFTALPSRLREGAPPEEAATWLEHVLAKQTGIADTHPSLTDRLKGMGVAPETAREFLGDAAQLAAAPAVSAATAYLGAKAESLAACLDQFWKQSIDSEWRERHRRATEARQHLATLEEKARAETLTEEEAFQRARLALEYRGQPEAGALFRDLLAANPDHAGASYYLGRLLLEEGDDGGIEHLEKAMEQDPETVLPTCRALFEYLKRQGRDTDAERYRERALAEYARLQRAEAQGGSKDGK